MRAKELNATIAGVSGGKKKKENEREKLCEFVLLKTKTNNESFCEAHCRKKEEN